MLIYIYIYIYIFDGYKQNKIRSTAVRAGPQDTEFRRNLLANTKTKSTDGQRQNPHNVALLCNSHIIQEVLNQKSHQSTVMSAAPPSRLKQNHGAVDAGSR